MRVIYYFFTFVFGLFGVGLVLRIVELLGVGAGIKPAQILMAIIMLALAVSCLKKARSMTIKQNNQ